MARTHLLSIATTLGCTTVLLMGGCLANVDAQGPNGMKLLPGYTHRPDRGIDTELGRISKSGGPDISYEIGGFRFDLAGELKRSMAGLWRKTQVVREHEFQVEMREGGRLYVATPTASFIAENVKTQEDVADVLLMVLAFDDEALPKPLK
jgi:hypothetical protein